jgi:plasmid stability protein
MTNLTIRNIPDDVINKIKTLSELERRSLNSEILFILERGLKVEIQVQNTNLDRMISRDVQIELWKNLASKWADSRTTDEIIVDIYSNRTLGREIDL